MMDKLTDKYRFTKEENKRFARSNITRLVHTSSRFEGVKTTLPQTQTIIDGMSVSGVSVEDILTIVNLKHGWQFVINAEDKLSLALEKKINQIVAPKDLLALNQRSEPQIINEQKEDEFLEKTLNDLELSTTDKALEIMYHNMRNQMFWDGNKRSAILAANKIMIDGGAGLINVPLDKWETWNTLISDYYRTGDNQVLKKWTYDNGIQGVNVREVK
ncbi:Fic family protein [Fructilactobacillus frigidiflavus]|uniref:Fic family protein n=1 Tax=Fructilactobacillus frigidiflavus TaxID=3242688 RepID=UPI0037575FC5